MEAGYGSLISLKHCEDTLNDATITDKQALDIHICVEGYFKRLFFIGLRLHEVQYVTAQQVMQRYWSRSLKELMKKAWDVSGIGYDGATKYSGYLEVERFVTTFSAHYRNQRVHGSQDEITDQRLLAAIIGVDKEIVRVSEQICEVTVGCSAFDKPGRWGAGRGRTEEVADVFQRLELRENRHEPPDIAEVENWLAKRGADGVGQLRWMREGRGGRPKGGPAAR